MCIMQYIQLTNEVNFIIVLYTFASATKLQ